MMRNTIITMLEASPEELYNLRFEMKPWPDDLVYYFYVLQAYHAGNIETLAELVKIKTSNNNILKLQKLAALRLAIRQYNFDFKFDLEENFELFQGDHLFLSGLYFEKKGLPLQAQKLYMDAAAELNQLGSSKESLRAEFNALVLQGQIDSNKRLIEEYHFFSKKARRLKQYELSGLAMINISREFQKTGANLAALSFCNKGLAYLNTIQGSIHYSISLLLRAEINFELGRHEEAMTDLQIANKSSFLETLALSKALEDKFFKKNVILSHQIRPRFQTQYASEIEQSSILSPLEDKLIRALFSGAKSKFELADILYGNQINFESAENRLKNLINRIRKKKTNLVHFTAGKYEICKTYKRL